MTDPHPHKHPRDWKRIGGPLASLALHLSVVWILVQRVGPAIASLPDGPDIIIGPVEDSPPFDPPPEDPEVLPTGQGLTTATGVDAPTLPDDVPVSSPGPQVDDLPPIDLAPVPLGPLTIRSLYGAGGGGSGGSFGYGRALSGDLVGTMYDLKRDARGEPRTPSYVEDVRKVLAGHLSSGAFGDFFRVTNQLYMSHLFVPSMPAEHGPAAFAAGDVVKPQNWLVHYRGSIRPPRGGTFRFVGMFDDLLMVLVDGKVVMEFLWTGDPTPWQPKEFVDQHPCFAGRPLVYGDWLTFDPNESHRIDILVGEHPGGLVGGVLMVQEKNHTYQVTPEGRPVLPVFTVQRPTVEERVRLVRFEKWAFDPEMPVFNTRPAPKLVEKAEDKLTVEII